MLTPPSILFLLCHKFSIVFYTLSLSKGYMQEFYIKSSHQEQKLKQKISFFLIEAGMGEHRAIYTDTPFMVLWEPPGLCREQHENQRNTR